MKHKPILFNPILLAAVAVLAWLGDTYLLPHMPGRYTGPEPVVAIWNWVIQLAIVLVSSIVSAALAPKPKPPKPAALGDFDLPTAEEGRPIPVVFGTVWVKGPNVIWYGDLKSKAIKAKGGKK